MKPKIHPNYRTTKVVCACGNTFTTRSYFKEERLAVKICSQCHPFFSGKEKIVDMSGRVDRFQKKYAKKA
jgi:large subunit ribosomal protein L31